MNPLKGMTILHMLFVIYQMIFAVVTLAILSSAAAERIRLSLFIIFGILWVMLVYEPFAHWLWGKMAFKNECD